MIAAFALASSALGLDLPAPWMMSGIVLGLSALSSLVLPPTYGAGPAAAAVFVFGLFGVPAADALAYSSLWWVISQIPAALSEYQRSCVCAEGPCCACGSVSKRIYSLSGPQNLVLVLKCPK